MVSATKLGFIGLGMFSFGLMSNNYGFFALLNCIIKLQINLKKNSFLRELWEELPQAFDFNIYIFNVTNPDEISSGGKPILQEVGPFHYDLYRSKKDLVDREEDDSVEYSTRQTWYFNASQSIMSQDAEIYAIHPLILMLGLITYRDQPSALGVINKAIDSIFKNPESIFVKTSVRELFFHGLLVDCTVTDFAATVVCAALEQYAEDSLVEEEESVYRFGFTAKTNGSTSSRRIRVLRGIKNYLDVGRLIAVNDMTEMDVWPGEPCNTFRGTDGNVFPPFLTQDTIVWLHAAEICRNLGAYYVEPTVTNGFKTLRFSISLGDPCNKDTKCYCTGSECKKNTFNVKPCLGVPIILSLPHFYDSDPKYVEEVEGLEPNPEKHMIILDIDELIGAPLLARFKLQFNFFVEPIPDFRLMESFPELLFPLFWLEDGIEVGDALLKPFSILYKMIFLMQVIMWLMILSGIGMMIAGIGMHYMKQYDVDIPSSPEIITPSLRKQKQREDRQLFRKINVGSRHPTVVPPYLD